MITRMLCLFALALAFAPTAQAAEIGDTIELPEFKDIRYLPRTIQDFPEHDYYVLYFLSNTCPLAQRYMGVMNEIEAEYAAKGVQFIGVNVSPADTIRDMAQHALEYEAYYPMVKDTDGDCAKALGITRTPEIAILDSDMVLRYRGRINDQFRLGGVRPKVSRHDLKLALDQLIAGEEVGQPLTKAEGCSLTFPSVPEPIEEITYSEHIAPILQNNCLQCHHPKGGAPFSLNTYNKVAARADMIEEVVTEERMPPWYAHEDYGTFAIDRSMNERDKLLIQQWVQAGKPEGNPDLLPPRPDFPDAMDWQIDYDVVIEARMPNALPATGYVPYRYILLPYEFEHDTYVEAIEIKSSNPSVMHHSNLFYASGSFEFARSQNFITGTVPGGMPTEVPDGHAIMIPEGSIIGLQIHYVTTGKPEMDTPMVALRFSKEPVQKLIRYNILDAKPLEIPPYARAYETVETAKLDDDVTVLGMFSHMHLRGRDMAFYANYPDGTRETLLSLPNYNFDWQLTYYVEPGQKVLPAGTVVECVAHFDNSAFNPYNPDPTIEVNYGPQTVDEMSQGFIFYVKNDEALNLQIDPDTGYPLEALASVE